MTVVRNFLVAATPLAMISLLPVSPAKAAEAPQATLAVLVKVDANSITETTVNYDLVQLSSSGAMFVWGTTTYGSLSAFRSATSQEQQGIQADPVFVSPAIDDYRLGAGSPAIDSADSSAAGEQTFDLAGAPRVDDPATSDTGVGPRTFDDRGSYEYQPTGLSSQMTRVRRRAQCLGHWISLSASAIKPLNCRAQAGKLKRKQS